VDTALLCGLIADMENRVILDNIAHADLRVVPQFGAEFGDSVNQVLVFPNEFQAVQREYPILFSHKENGGFQAVAITGLDRDQNLFLDQGSWAAKYVPAVNRRGPFVIGASNEPQTADPVILINIDDPRVKPAGGEGHPVFLAQGGMSHYLEEIADVLRIIHLGVEMSDQVYEEFDAMQLLAPVSLQLQVSEAEQIDLKDYFAITPDKLSALNGGSLAQLHQNGLLAIAFHAATSLDNFADLIRRRAMRQQTKNTLA
jgi:hypothetical protein